MKNTPANNLPTRNRASKRSGVREHRLARRTTNKSGASLARKPAVRSGVGGVPRPLKWQPHHVKDNGYYGVTATGYECCYVYQPWDNRIRRGPMPWQVFSYFGGKDHPLTGTARFGGFPTAAHAKRAAQQWWRGKMLALLSGGGGAEHGERKRESKSRAGSPSAESSNCAR